MIHLHEVLPAFAQFLQHDASYQGNTIAAYLTDLRKGVQALRRVLGRDPELSDLRPENLLAALQEEAASGLRRSTLQRRVASWRALERYLLQQSLVEAPFLPAAKDVKALWQDRDELDQVVCLRSEHLAQLWQTLLSQKHRQAIRDLALMALLLEWGFSSQTLIQLNLSDVDLEAGVLRITYPVRGPVEFPLRASLEPLRRYLQQGRPEFNPPPHEDALFVSQLGRRLSRQSLWQLVRKWGEEARLPMPLTPRLLRHTAVYRMVRQGMPLPLIGLALGHSNPISTGILLRRLQRLCGDMPPAELPVSPALPHDEEPLGA